MTGRLARAANRVLVTGCGGYVGHQVATRLIHSGLEVAGTSRRSLSLGGVEVLVGDHLDPAFVAAAVSRVDTVLHFAARTRGHDPASFRRDNEDVTTLFSRCAQRMGKRLIYVSSDQALYETGHYGRSKRACEAIVAGEHGDYAILRLTAVLGRYAPDMGSTFSRIIQQLHRSSFLVMPGDGDYPIAPIWVGDIASALQHLIATPSQLNQVFEACGATLSLAELIDLFERRLGVRRRRVRLPLPPLQLAARALKPFSVFARLPLDALLDLGAPIGVSYRALNERFGFTPTLMADAVPKIEDFPG